MDTAFLAKNAEPWFHVCPGAAGDVADELGQWQSAAPAARVARFIRGKKCGSTADFFDEVAAALQFPIHFGENWDAFADCLSDWSRADGAAVICFLDADKLLSGAAATAARNLATILSDCCQSANGRGKSRALHVVLHGPATKAAAIRKRWQEAGVSIG